MNDETSINKQIDRLPTKIGKFIRRFAHLSDGYFVIQYTTNGFYSHGTKQNLSVASNNDVLYIETSKSIEDVVDKILVKIEIDHRLEKTDNHSQPIIYIDQELIDQGVTRISIIQATTTATIIAPCEPLPQNYSHIYFFVQTEGYLLAFGRKGNNYFLRRNEVCVSLSIPPPKAISAKKMSLATVWSLAKIGITGYLASHEKNGTKPIWEAKFHDWKQTVPTIPPNSLYNWARKQLLIPEKIYVRPGEVFNVVSEALQTMNKEISVTNDLSGFWDTQLGEDDEGKKSKSLVPKREPAITKHIESRIRDITLMNNLTVAREIEIGNGKLDLLFSAPLIDGTTAKVCVEVKKAHAGYDLVHGLSTQLPEYMRRLDTDYGVYCVLHFGKDYQHKVTPFKELLPDHTLKANFDLYQRDLGILLTTALGVLPHRNMVAITIDVSQKPSPSQM